MGETEGLEYRTVLAVGGASQDASVLNGAFADVEIITLSLAGSEPGIDQMSESILSQEERQRAGRATYPSDRTARLGSQLLLRFAISRRLGGAPAAWRFRRSPTGQLMLNGHESGRVRFSIARTAGMVAVATTTGTTVGIDVEGAQRLRDANLHPSDWLSPLEIAGEIDLDAAQRDRDRLQRWTLKEAYSKALGTGFVLPPREMGFILSQDHRSARLERLRSPTKWCFLSVNLANESIVSLAIMSRAPTVD